MTSFDSKTLFHPVRQSWKVLTCDAVLIGSLRLVALLTSIIVVLILGFLLRQSYPALSELGLGAFFRSSSWNPLEGSYSITEMIWCSLFVSLGAVALALPLGVMSAIFIHYYAPKKVAFFYQHALELLAGIPSVIYGFWGLVVLVPLIAKLHPPGPSLLAGIVVLGAMLLPTICLTVSAKFSTLPNAYLYGAASLGFSRWSTVWRVVFPLSKSGIWTGLILATGRAIGETMALLMVCGNVVQMPQSLFDPIRPLTVNIALEMAYALDTHRSALFVCGLTLMGVVLALVLLADTLFKDYLYD